MTGRAGRDTPAGGPARRRRVVRPVRLLVPLASCGAVLLAWGLVAHNSGAGWVQAVGDILAGILAVGLVAPAVVAASARIEIVESPGDGTAGLPVELAAMSTSRLRVRPLHPPGPKPSWGRTGRPTPAVPAS